MSLAGPESKNQRGTSRRDASKCHVVSQMDRGLLGVLRHRSERLCDLEQPLVNSPYRRVGLGKMRFDAHSADSNRDFCLCCDPCRSRECLPDVRLLVRPEQRVFGEPSRAPSAQGRHPIAGPPTWRHAAAHQIERARMSSPLAAVRLSSASDGNSSTVEPSVDTSSPLRRHVSWMVSA